MHKSINNLNSIENTIKSVTKNINIPSIIAVSKTFPMNDILPLINHGHIHFGENKVQESLDKWSTIKQDFKHIKLHMVGKLQTNKVKFVIGLFDYLHSLDNFKLAEKISLEQKKKNKKIKIFIQVNIGDEPQKNGIDVDQLKNFYNKCMNDLELEIIGLMCLPPKDNFKINYFEKMKVLADQMKLEDLSMGMSEDYTLATQNGATFLRIGSKIFGERT